MHPKPPRSRSCWPSTALPAQAELLVLACGTGGHIPYFQDDYRVSGLDLSQDMLGLAREKFPGIGFHLGDLIDFNLEAEFDALICLYGSIGFVRTVDNLRASLRRMAAHLRPGGLALITPWSTVEEFQDMIVVDAVDRPGWKIARLEQVRLKEPKIVEVTFHHLLGKDNQVTYHKQSMEIGLFSREEYLTALTGGRAESRGGIQGTGRAGRGLYRQIIRVTRKA